MESLEVLAVDQESILYLVRKLEVVERILHLPEISISEEVEHQIKMNK